MQAASPNTGTRRAEFADAIRAGDRVAADAAARELLTDGMPLLDLYELLTDTMEEVGECWSAGEMSVAEEHAATAAATYVVNRLRGAPPAASRGTVVLTTVESERHLLGIDVLAHLFEAARYRAVTCGDAPLGDVIGLCAEQPELRAVMLSVHAHVDGTAVRRAVRALREGTRAERVVLGGPAFARSPGAGAARYGADAILLSARDALTYVGGQSSPLTERETQVLQCVADGMSNGEAADALGVAASTVKDHVESICRKLGVTSRTAAVTKALRAGLLG